jgi:hypothetical protein
MTIIAAVAFSLFFAEIGSLHRSLRLNFKPFNCVPCLCVWSAVVLNFIPQHFVVDIATYFGAGVIGAIVARLINKL